MNLLHTTWSTWTAGGILLIPLAAVCVGIWAYFLRSQDRMTAISKECKALEPAVEQNGLHELEEGSVSTLLSRIQKDIEGGKGPRSAFYDRCTACLDGLRHDILILSALTAVAPLIGLLGTVRGMVGTFSAVSQVAGDTGTEVAAGISQALLTTQFGLVIALPGVFGVSRLRALVREVEARFGTLRAAALGHLEAPR